MAANPSPHILLVISGGISAYKTLELVRLIKKKGLTVQAVLTRAAEKFVTPLSLQTLTEEQVVTNMFSLENQRGINHISLSRRADLVIVCPATANLLAKMTHGLADDLASTLLLANNRPTLVVPAMNKEMWYHPATQANISTLIARGITFCGPDKGDMACHETGMGRMSEPVQIMSYVETLTQSANSTKERPLAGKTALVTAGPTKEPIDPIRYLTNRSSGFQGYAIAKALEQLGATVTLVSGPTSLPPPNGHIICINVETAQQMMEACQSSLPVDIAVMAAAVTDWKMKTVSEQKIKKRPDDTFYQLKLVSNPDILVYLSRPGVRRPHLVVGFAAETHDLVNFAKDKLQRKGCDWIVANDVRPQTGVMGGDENEVVLVTHKGVQHWPRASKDDIARQLATAISIAFSAGEFP